jgi:hypothetical protein
VESRDLQAEEKTVYEGGSTRTKLDVRYELIPKEAIDALARRLTLGAAKHGDHNWKGGGEEFRKATINHLMKHLLEYMESGNLKDANTDALICNAAFLAYFEAQKPYKQ